MAIEEGGRVTQEDLANRIGVSRTSVAAWEANTQEPTGENLLSLSRALGVSPAHILYGVHQQSLLRDSRVQVDTWRAAARYLRSSDRPGGVEEATVLERCADQMEEVIQRFLENSEEDAATPIEPAEHARRMGKIAREHGGQGPGEGSGKRKSGSGP